MTKKDMKSVTCKHTRLTEESQLGKVGDPVHDGQVGKHLVRVLLLLVDWNPAVDAFETKAANETIKRSETVAVSIIITMLQLYII